MELRFFKHRFLFYYSLLIGLILIPIIFTFSVKAWSAGSNNLFLESQGWFGSCDWTQNSFIVGTSLSSENVHCARLRDEANCGIKTIPLFVYRNECLWNLNEVSVYKKGQQLQCHQLEASQNCRIKLINPRYSYIDCDYLSGEVLIAASITGEIRCVTLSVESVDK